MLGSPPGHEKEQFPGENLKAHELLKRGPWVYFLRNPLVGGSQNVLKVLLLKGRNRGRSVQTPTLLSLGFLLCRPPLDLVA